jgi:hypothetical protein
MRDRLKTIAPLVAGLLIGWAVTAMLSGRPAATLPAMPVPVLPDGPNKPSPDVLRASRVEVLDGSGKVAIVLTSENGVPTAIVSDGGAARKIDLAKVARLVK